MVLVGISAQRVSHEADWCQALAVLLVQPGNESVKCVDVGVVQGHLNRLSFTELMPAKSFIEVCRVGAKKLDGKVECLRVSLRPDCDLGLG